MGSQLLISARIFGTILESIMLFRTGERGRFPGMTRETRETHLESDWFPMLGGT